MPCSMRLPCSAVLTWERLTIPYLVPAVRWRIRNRAPNSTVRSVIFKTCCPLGRITFPALTSAMRELYRYASADDLPVQASGVIRQPCGLPRAPFRGPSTVRVVRVGGYAPPRYLLRAKGLLREPRQLIYHSGAARGTRNRGAQLGHDGWRSALARAFPAMGRRRQIAAGRN